MPDLLDDVRDVARDVRNTVSGAENTPKATNDDDDEPTQ
jgi:hypothetical protein